MTVGQPDVFTIDVYNSGPNDAWNETIRDVLPDGATGGLCDATPQVLSARVFAADGVTPVPGKGPLVAGSDFTLSWAGAPTCDAHPRDAHACGGDRPGPAVDHHLSDPARRRQPGWRRADQRRRRHRMVRRRKQRPEPCHVHADVDRRHAGVLDHEDAHTVTVSLPRHLFEKTVMNVTTGADPATTASPGRRPALPAPSREPEHRDSRASRVRRRARRLNTAAAFAPGHADAGHGAARCRHEQHERDGRRPRNGRRRHPQPDRCAGRDRAARVRGHARAGDRERELVTNQSQLRIDDVPFADSDDPNVNGPADPLSSGDEDPTRVQIAVGAAASASRRSRPTSPSTRRSCWPGETLRYTITVKNVGTARMRPTRCSATRSR